MGNEFPGHAEFRSQETVARRKQYEMRSGQLENFEAIHGYSNFQFWILDSDLAF